MRRKDREVTDFQSLVNIIRQCQVCRLALHDGDYPYIVPVNFGFETQSEIVTLYFHGANEGKKYDLMHKDPRASFEMDCETLLCSDQAAGNCTMSYHSVMGRGTIEFLEGEEKIHALNVLTAHYHPEGFAYDARAIPATTAFKLTVTEMTGKIRPIK